jgi:hypothetical protein
MKRVWLVVVMGACKQNAAPPPPTPAKVAPPPAPTCSLDGDYRVRFSSNGTDGWWLPFTIAGGKATVTARVSMFGWDKAGTAMTLAVEGCTAKLAGKSENAGDIGLSFTLDPKTNAITGELTRTAGADEQTPAKQPVKGRKDVGGLGGPACLKPGVFELHANGTWKLAEGSPRFGMTCKSMAEPATQAFVRIQPLGDDIVVNEVENSPNHEQAGGSFEVKRLGDCELDVKVGVQDFDFDGKLTLASDTITGTSPEAHYSFMEDGDAGENLWSCKAKNATITGKRIADQHFDARSDGCTTRRTECGPGVGVVMCRRIGSGAWLVHTTGEVTSKRW